MAKFLHRKRFDYFVIWGHGVRYKDEIIEIIGGDEFIDIVKIIQHTPKDIRKLIKSIYSYDYAPLNHLKSKTKYLLNTDKKVIFLFVINRNVNEVYRGHGAFRHVECERITNLKEKIRNQFNPRNDGIRSENHVIHASDNESQVDSILKYLGFSHGLNYLRNNPNAILSLPYYIPRFEQFIVRLANTSQLFCSILRGNREHFWKERVAIEKTPHYLCLNGSVEAYESYLSKFLGGPLTSEYSTQKFLNLSREIVYLEKPYDTSYILVKEFQPSSYLILDGVHRASILKFRDIDEIPIALVK